MRLLDLVEQDDLIGTAAHGFGERAALLVADIARRRADQPRDRVLLHVLGHVEADHRGLVVEQEAASAFVSSVLPTPVGPRNMNEPIGRLGSCKPARARRTAVATAFTASFWPTTRRASAPPSCSSFSRLAFEHLVDGHAGPARHDLRDVIGADHLIHERASALPSPRRRPACFSSSGMTP